VNSRKDSVCFYVNDGSFAKTLRLLSNFEKFILYGELKYHSIPGKGNRVRYKKNRALRRYLKRQEAKERREDRQSKRC
jgi:hypothetical protein